MDGFEKRAKEKKQQVLDVTFQLMNSEAGVAGLTIDRIVTTSKVSKATIFKYFGSKEQLIYQVFFTFLNELAQTSREIMKQNLPFEETLLAMSHHEIQTLEKVHQQFYLDLMHYYTKKDKDNELATLMDQITKEGFEVMLDLFHRGRKEGKVDLKYSDEFLILYFQAMVEGLSSPKIYEKILPYTSEWTEMLLKGLAPRK